MSSGQGNQPESLQPEYYSAGHFVFRRGFTLLVGLPRLSESYCGPSWNCAGLTYVPSGATTPVVGGSSSIGECFFAMRMTEPATMGIDATSAQLVTDRGVPS